MIMSLLSSTETISKSSSTTVSLSPSTSLSSSSPVSSDLQLNKCKNHSEFSTVSLPLQNSRINKMSCKRREHKRTIAKLRRMLSHKKNIVKCSELELINHIMDYIISLQEMLQNQENLIDENQRSNIDIANLNRALSRFHLCATNNTRRPLWPSKQLYN